MSTSTWTSDPARNDSHRSRWLLGGLVVALAIRIFGLGKQSLWLDECATWFFSGSANRAIVAEPTNPPLYYSIVYIVRLVFGSSEFSLRLFSALASCGVLIASYSLARRGFNERVATIAAVFIAISPFQIAYAQEARAFSLLTLLVLGAAYALFVAIQKPTSERAWVTFALLSLVSFYTHIIAVFFVSAMVLVAWFASADRADRSRLVAWSAIAALGFSPWLLHALNHGGGGQHRRYLLLKLPQAYFSWIFGDSLIPLDEAAVQHISATLLQNWVWLASSVVAIGALYFAGMTRQLWSNGRIKALFAISTLPIAMAFVVSFKIMLFDERYLQPVAPYLAIAIATLSDAALRSHGARRIGGLFATAVVFTLQVVSLKNYFFNQRFGKENWREAIAWVDARAIASNSVVVFEPGYVHYCSDYYSVRDTPSITAWDERVGQLLRFEPPISNILGSAKRVFLVRSHFDSNSVHASLSQHLQPRDSVRFANGMGIDVFLFEQR